MKLSVVIPAYKAAFLSRIISALKDLQCDEILVVDSGPKTSSISVEDSRLQFIYSNERLLPGAARNRGAELCKGDWILFLDADVELTAEAIQYLNALQDVELSPQTLYWGLYVPGGLSVWTRLQNKILNYRFDDLFNKSKRGRHGQSSHVLVNKNWFWNIGGFNPYVRMREDTELAQRSSIFFGQQVLVRELRGVHLKEFNLIGLFLDYFTRIQHSLFSQFTYRKVFSDLDPFVSTALKVLWLCPIALSMLLFINWSSQNIVIAAFMWVSVCILCVKSMNLKLSAKEFSALLVAAPLMGLGLIFGIVAAMVRIATQNIQHFTSSLRHTFNLVIKYLFKYGSPVHLTHFITNKCNLRCNHCFYKETLDVPAEQMDLKKTQELYSSVGSLLWLAVAGGEPFLRRDLVPLLSLAIEQTAPKFLTIPTNGFYTDRIFLDMLRLVQKYPKQKVALQFSIDGDQATHDQIRGPKSWKNLEASIAKMKHLRKVYPQINLSIITVINKENEQLYPQLIDHLVQHFGLDQIHINLFRYGNLNAPPLPLELVEKYRQTIDYNFKRAESSLGMGYEAWVFKLVTRIAKKQKEMIYQTAKDNKFMVPCEAGTLSYTVWESGKIGPCEILSERKYFSNFKQFWKSPELNSLRRKIKSEKCRCTYECAMTVNALMGRAQYEK